MLGGQAASVTRSRSILSTLGAQDVRTGKGWGRGAYDKMVAVASDVISDRPARFSLQIQIAPTAQPPTYDPTSDAKPGDLASPT